MKLQRHRFSLIALALSLSLLALGVFFLFRSLHASALPPPPEESRLQSLKESVIPGSVLDRNGIVLAASEESGVRKYQDTAERRASVVHVVGVDSGLIPGGMESRHIASLYGLRPTLSEAVGRLLRKQEGLRNGYDLTLTVSADLCEQLLRSAASHPETAGKNCGVVIVQYLTGEIVAMASLPTFDPGKLSDASAEALRESADQPLLNRVTEAVYPLGSLSEAFSPLSAFFRSRSVSFRDLSMAAPEDLSVTPLQLCLMTCAAAGDGTAPEPRLIRTVKTAAGGIVIPWSSSVLGRLCSANDAESLKKRMKSCVADGAASLLYDPIQDLHGLPGSAETDGESDAPRRFSWFTGFNAQKDAPFAVCVLLEDPAPEYAETAALLIARDCFSWLKSHPNLLNAKPARENPVQSNPV